MGNGRIITTNPGSDEHDYWFYFFSLINFQLLFFWLVYFILFYFFIFSAQATDRQAPLLLQPPSSLFSYVVAGRLPFSTTHLLHLSIYDDIPKGRQKRNRLLWFGIGHWQMKR
jgi:hypothetical protein